ncbi:protein tyrosine kinase [Moniliophthora roreri MCA 2997]|uniref:Twinfilin n=2 Tax=Moniliophthora roreri TaxID=221103 RepID=V2YRD4_MONRO|nr:protein tyrosine kinase [Moniliophthora roreri MCA 2997]KAI3607496.1 protein tyrosine kinase [Moniliophthora roreri]
MSASSGISVSPDLTQQFSTAVDQKSTRFIKVSIQNESLVHDLSIPISGTLQEDLEKLQDDSVLKDDVPAYILAKLDDPPSEWLAIYYVPDSAKVRDKMLYASTRASLLKSLGSTSFTDSIFATSRSDITPASYAAHLASLNAPKPLSAREKEIEDAKAAERAATNASYQGSSGRASHLGGAAGGKIGMPWSDEAEKAIEELGSGEDASVVVIKIDVPKETLVLHSHSETSVDQLSSVIPKDDASYVFFAWPHTHDHSPKREIIFIYSCPTTTPIKHRMLYSSGALIFFREVQAKIKSTASSEPSTVVNTRKIETSEPTELDEAFLLSELRYDGSNQAESQQLGSEGSVPGSGARTPLGTVEEKKFAKPRGPARRKA